MFDPELRFRIFCIMPVNLVTNLLRNQYSSNCLVVKTGNIKLKIVTVGLFSG